MLHVLAYVWHCVNLISSNYAPPAEFTEASLQRHALCTPGVLSKTLGPRVAFSHATYTLLYVCVCICVWLAPQGTGVLLRVQQSVKAVRIIYFWKINRDEYELWSLSELLSRIYVRIRWKVFHRKFIHFVLTWISLKIVFICFEEPWRDKENLWSMGTLNIGMLPQTSSCYWGIILRSVRMSLLIMSVQTVSLIVKTFNWISFVVNHCHFHHDCSWFTFHTWVLVKSG